MHRSTYLSIIGFLLICCFVSCKENTIDFVQIGSISGKVLEEGTEEPLEGVEITTVPATSVVFTDSTGSFLIENVAAADNYRLRASFDNYQTESVSISVVGTTETTSTIFLKSEAGILNNAINPTPADNASDIGVEVQLRWQNPNDTTIDVTFDIEIYEANSNEIFQKIESLEDTFTTVQSLKFSSQYFWQVITKNSIGEEEFGPVWKFNTLSVPDNPILITIPNESGFNEIYSISEQGAASRLTYTTTEKFSPIYNPDRSMIAFIGIDGFDQHIYLMDREGSNATKVTTLPVASYHQQGRGFGWSPDGSKLIYCHYDKLYSIKSDGTDLTELATAPADRHFRSCHWGESTNQIIVETIGSNIYDGEIYLMDADGSNMAELVANAPGILENPSLSIDGINFIYTLDLSENESLSGRQLDASILIAPIADPTNTTNLSESKQTGTNDLFPGFSSNGAKVIFLNRSNNETGVGSINTVEVAEPTERNEIISGAEYPSWR